MSDIGSDLMGEVYRFEVKRRGTRTQQIAPRYTQELHFNAQAVGLSLARKGYFNLDVMDGLRASYKGGNSA